MSLDHTVRRLAANLVGQWIVQTSESQFGNHATTIAITSARGQQPAPV